MIVRRSAIHCACARELRRRSSQVSIWPASLPPTGRPPLSPRATRDEQWDNVGGKQKLARRALRPFCGSCHYLQYLDSAANGAAGFAALRDADGLPSVRRVSNPVPVSQGPAREYHHPASRLQQSPGRASCK